MDIINTVDYARVLAQTPCPTCGHCPTCGRTNTPSLPLGVYPYPPNWGTTAQSPANGTVTATHSADGSEQFVDIRG